MNASAPESGNRHAASGSDSGETLASLLRARARATPDGVLVAAAAVGLLAAVGDLVWRPHNWITFLCVTGCLAAFGLFGIADRELDSPIAPHSEHAIKALRAARVAAMILGAVAGFTMLLTVLTFALGTWIS